MSSHPTSVPDCTDALLTEWIHILTATISCGKPSQQSGGQREANSCSYWCGRYISTSSWVKYPGGLRKICEENNWWVRWVCSIHNRGVIRGWVTRILHKCWGSVKSDTSLENNQGLGIREEDGRITSSNRLRKKWYCTYEIECKGSKVCTMNTLILKLPFIHCIIF